MAEMQILADPGPLAPGRAMTGPGPARNDVAGNLSLQYKSSNAKMLG